MFFLSEHYLNGEGQNTNCDIIMIAEFVVIPIGAGESLSGYVADCIRIVKESGLRYKLTPMGTILEGGYDEVMETVRRCHIHIRSQVDRVMTEVRIDDRAHHLNDMEGKVKSVEEKMEG